MMAGAALFSEIAARSFAGHDSTIKVALVGCGFRGTGAATQVLSTRGPVKLWAMADLFQDRLDGSYNRLVHGIQADYDREASAGFAARIDVPPERRFVGFDAYQKAIDSGVDLVLLTTNQHFRPAHFAYAVDRGKHVFMEKPLGVDVPGIHQLLAANEEAKKKNLKVGVGLVMRHTRHVQECIRRVKEGAIGPVGLMCCYFNFSGLRETPSRPDDMSEMTYQLRNPYHFQWLSGDYIVDAVVHYLDLALWLHGNPPVTAQGQGGRQAYLPNFQGDTFDHIIVEYTFDDRTKLFAQTRQMSGCWIQSTLHAYGPKGCADVFHGRIDGQSAWHARGGEPNPYQVEHDLLVEAIRGDQPYNDVDRAATATLLGIMGRMAAYSGQEITWQQVLDTKVRLAPQAYAFDAPPPAVPDKTGRYPVAMPGVTRPY
jgi:predicted dehydrogenase